MGCDCEGSRIEEKGGGIIEGGGGGYGCIWSVNGVGFQIKISSFIEFIDEEI